MNTSDKNAVQDMRQAFDLTGAAPQGGLAGGHAGVTAKVFKSGNSLALRLPKALGLEAGMEMVITPQDDGSYALRRAEPPRRKIDVSGFWGKAPGIKLAPREDFEDRPSTIAAREAARKAAGLA